MKEKTDLRIQRTYKLLTDALIQLMAEKKFEYIQVNEICERAMVRRATFYKHFGDKYELFTFLITEIRQKFHENNTVEYDPKHPHTYYVGMVEQTFIFLEQNRAMVTSIVNSNSSHILLDLLSEQIENQVRDEFRADEKRGATMPVKPELLAPMFTGALIYLAKWWILQDYKIPREEIVHECASVLKLM